MKKPFFLFLLLTSLTGFSQDSIRNSFVVKTIGPLPFLEYGLGDDRLGGAKMGYLDTNILLKVIDSAGTDYLVQLSRNHRAYIAKANVQFLPDSTLRPYYLSSSWRVWGDDLHDYVSIMVEERLPYRSIQQVNPSRVVVDLFGVTSNTNWITQLRVAKEVKNVWLEQIDDDVLRIFIELKHQQHWGYGINYDSAGRRLIVKIKRQPEKLKAKNLRVAIDAGHGGVNTGAVGVTTKIQEKEYTLKFAKELEKYLKRKKVSTVMTRSEDVDISMVDRTLLLRKEDPHLLVSLHLNSSGNQNIKGVSTYYRYIGFRSLTQEILKKMLELELAEFGNIGSFNFALSGPTEYPNCLVEIAFLSNAEDEQRIMDPKFQKAVAKKIYKGIRNWLKAVKKMDDD